MTCYFANSDKDNTLPSDLQGGRSRSKEFIRGPSVGTKGVAYNLYSTECDFPFMEKEKKVSVIPWEQDGLSDLKL